MKDQDPQIILFAPLYGQPMAVSTEDRRKARKVVFENRNDPAVKHLFNMIERAVFRMQGEGVAAGSTTHDQGQACGALHIYGLARTWLEQPPPKEEQADA